LDRRRDQEVAVQRQLGLRFGVIVAANVGFATFPQKLALVVFFFN
jgi:hypothetical protein